MESAVIIDAVRSPMGRGEPGGALSEVHAVELLAQVLRALMDRNDLDPELVDDVLIGCVSQAADQAGTPGRWAWLAAGLPEHVPAVTIDRRCGSSQQAIHFAAQGVICGEYDVVVVGGIESMSRVPMESARLGADPFGPARSRYAPDLVSPGISAELVAAKWKLTRDQLDEYAAGSHQRAAEVAACGEFDREIVPITSWTEHARKVVHVDETIRPDTTPESLSALRPAHADSQSSERFPEIRWQVTEGNSAQRTDGASAMLIMSERRAEELGLRPRARFRAFSLACDDPITMLTAPIPATHKVLAKAGLRVHDVDHFEVNEAYAAVPLAWLAEFDVNPDLLNPRGGAIALGHPRGASGTRLMTTMLNALEDTGGRYGLQTMCEGGGMANATVIERY